MNRRVFRYLVVAWAVLGVANVAQAAVAGSFEFGFFSDVLRALFALPFRLVGCAAG